MATVNTKQEWEAKASVDDAIHGIEAQESEVRLKRFNASVAYAIGQEVRRLLEEEFKNDSALISIRTWDGVTSFQSAYGENVCATNEDWVRRKCNSVRTFKVSSFLLGRQLVKKGREIDSLSADLFAAHGGAFPIRIQGEYNDPIGAVIVSGLKQWQDHDVVVRAMASINALL